jgi:hypothetical protein
MLLTTALGSNKLVENVNMWVRRGRGKLGSGLEARSMGTGGNGGVVIDGRLMGNHIPGTESRPVDTGHGTCGIEDRNMWAGLAGGSCRYRHFQLVSAEDRTNR